MEEIITGLIGLIGGIMIGLIVIHSIDNSWYEKQAIAHHAATYQINGDKAIFTWNQ